MLLCAMDSFFSFFSVSPDSVMQQLIVPLIAELDNFSAHCPIVCENRQNCLILAQMLVWVVCFIICKTEYSLAVMCDSLAATVTYSIVGIVINCRFHVDGLNCIGLLLSVLTGLSL